MILCGATATGFDFGYIHVIDFSMKGSAINAELFGRGGHIAVPQRTQKSPGPNKATKTELKSTVAQHRMRWRLTYTANGNIYVNLPRRRPIET